MTEEITGRVLVVEDEPAIARLLQVELGASGFEVRLAGDGNEALAAVVEEVPDVVIADVMMPRMGGFELVRRLREDPRTEDVSIIMLTARGLKADKLEGLTAGADDYLTKPFDNEELVTRVRGVIRRARYMRSQSPLTGLPGNLRIEDEIEARIATGEPFALLYVDLDHFKAFSDRYGFVRGDEALRETGALVRESARRVAGAGSFVGHIGGDDFVVLVDPDSDGGRRVGDLREVRRGRPELVRPGGRGPRHHRRRGPRGHAPPLPDPHGVDRRRHHRRAQVHAPGRGRRHRDRDEGAGQTHDRAPPRGRPPLGRPHAGAGGPVRNPCLNRRTGFISGGKVPIAGESQGDT